MEQQTNISTWLTTVKGRWEVKTRRYPVSPHRNQHIRLFFWSCSKGIEHFPWCILPAYASLGYLNLNHCESSDKESWRTWASHPYPPACISGPPFWSGVASPPLFFSFRQPRNCIYIIAIILEAVVLSIMANPTEPNEPKYDTVTIFDEFNDPERRSMVELMIRRSPSLHQICWCSGASTTIDGVIRVTVDSTSHCRDARSRGWCEWDWLTRHTCEMLGRS